MEHATPKSTPATPVVGQIAQTNLQLLQQMRNQGYSAADLAAVSNAYRTAAALFANRFRACGKHFTSHLVGTSGVLVWLQAPIHVVVGALLHAAYQEGDFANSLEGMTASKRVALRQVIGDEAEAVVAAYTVGSRSLDGILASHARFNQMSSFEREILLIQLANELDDYRDLAALYAANAEERIAKIRQCGRQQVELAEWLGYSELARVLQTTYAESMAAVSQPSLVSAFADGYSIVPASCRVRYGVLARTLLLKITNRLRRYLVALERRVSSAT